MGAVGPGAPTPPLSSEENSVPVKFGSKVKFVSALSSHVVMNNKRVETGLIMA